VAGPLATAYLAESGETARDADASLEAALVRMLDGARRAWPQLALAPDAFLRAAARAAKTRDPAALARLPAADLYLACACAAGVAGAAAALEERYFGGVAAAVRSLDPSPQFADEVRAALREKLFLGREGPGIGAYAATGPLAAWLRMAARRLGLNLKASQRPAPHDEEALLELPTPEAGPELRLLRDRCGQELKRALHEVVAALSARERLMLRLHYVDGLSLGRIGTIYGCHQTSVSRAVQSARGRLVEQTRRLLAERLQLAKDELDSLLGMVESGLDLSLSRALASHGAA
jgi:RNA polymerase sigma-70 factor (ECF subfamily)